MSGFVDLNGRISSSEEAKISPFDRGFLLGDGFFEVLKVEKGAFVHLEDHLDRLFLSIEEMGFVLEISRKELQKRMENLLRMSGYELAYFRVTITGGEGLGFSVDREALKPNIYLFIKPLEEQALKPVSLKIVYAGYKDSSRRRKTNNYSASLKELTLAKKEGYDDILWVNEEGEITEASAANVFFVKDKIVVTPHPSSGLLEGVTRKNLISSLKEKGFEVSERVLLEKEIRNFDSCFLTSSIKGIVPVSKISCALGDSSASPQSDSLTLCHPPTSRINSPSS